MNFLTSTAGKIIVGTFVIIAIYYLLVYYKGGASYISNGSTAFNNGVSTLMQPYNRTYAAG